MDTQGGKNQIALEQLLQIDILETKHGKIEWLTSSQTLSSENSSSNWSIKSSVNSTWND